MEKGYRLLKCPGCPKTLKISVSAENYGKKIEVTCPNCRSKSRTTIPVPAIESQSDAGRSKTNPFDFADLNDVFGSFKVPKK